MARFPPAVLFFLLATFIGHVFALPLLRRDDISQLKADIQAVTSDVTSLRETINRPAWAHTLAAQRNAVASSFSTTSKAIQKCITDVNSITRSLDSADADIILKLAEIFGNTVMQMLGNVRSKYYYYKEQNMEWNILKEVRNLDGGVMGMTGKLQSVLPYQSQGAAKSLQQQMGPAFQQTISLYSSS